MEVKGEPGTLLQIGVALSGNGTTLQCILDEIAAGSLPVEVMAVVSSREDAHGLERARKAGLPAQWIDHNQFGSRETYSRAIFDFLSAHDAEMVALAGFLRRLWLPPEWEGRVLNIHPALLPAFGGQGMYGDRVHRAVLDSGQTESGCTVHFVNDQYDAGPVLLQQTVPVLPDDTVESLRERVQAAERKAYPEALRMLAEREVCWVRGKGVVTKAMAPAQRPRRAAARRAGSNPKNQPGPH